MSMASARDLPEPVEGRAEESGDGEEDDGREGLRAVGGEKLPAGRVVVKLAMTMPSTEANSAGPKPPRHAANALATQNSRRRVAAR